MSPRSEPPAAPSAAKGGAAVDTWVRAAIAAAGDTLEGLPKQEAGSWLLRNWCELVAILLATGNAEAVRHVHSHARAHYPASASPQFAQRLEHLMALAGLDLPASAVTDATPPASTAGLDSEALHLARALCRFADAVREGVSDPAPCRDIGPAAVSTLLTEAAPLHGLGVASAHPVPVDDTAPYLWRRWFVFPTTRGGSAPFLLFPAERCSWDQAVVWTGVHDASHLLHLATLRFGVGPAPIELNAGLLLAESVAMVAEILAASASRQAGSGGRADILWRGLAERLARVPAIVDALAYDRDQSPTVAFIGEAESTEFMCLPTLALAYSAGPLRLVATRFAHPLVPRNLRDALSAAWTKRAQVDPALHELTSELQP